MLEKYAQLLVDYSLEIQPKEKLFIQSSLLAAPLVKEIYRLATRRGGIVETDIWFQGRGDIFMEEASFDEQFDYVSNLYKEAMQHFDAYLYIRAPFEDTESKPTHLEKRKKRQLAYTPYRDIYSKRTATRELKRSLCQYPTLATAKEAGMSLEDYTNFVYTACNLHHEDPTAAWLKVREQQQGVVDHLNTCSKVRYVTQRTDIEFSTKGRTWINSDGQTNMPSGEVYTSPVENSVNGTIYFSLPSLYQGRTVRDVQLWVKDGYIEKWEASEGKDFLDEIFSLEGTRRFGEAAIGNNYNIQRITKNILFDEKIGGTVHMAIGQSYLQAGGKNTSSVHWDMITDMRNGGKIFADEEKIYENGQFLI
ncbi:MAG: aminopeptidase [Bacteroidota bacterium]